MYNVLMKTYFEHKLKNLINVSKIVTIHCFEFEKNFKTEGESHDFWELVFAEKESLICTADGAEQILEQGELLFHKPGEFHTLSANGQKAPCVMILSFVCKSEAMQFFENKKIKPERSLCKFIYSILEEGKRTFDIPFSDPKLQKMRLLENPSLGGEQLIKNYLEILLINLLRAQTETEGGNKTFLPHKEYAAKPVTDVIAVMESSLGEALTVDDICHRTAYGRAYLFRIFKATTGKTMMEYYLSLKIERAKQLLREDELSVREISASLAFSEPNYFTKIFKKFTGLTPSAYKKRAMGL